MTHRQLLEAVWGKAFTLETHYPRVYTNQLRQTLEKDPSRPRYLLTETGIGYRIRADVVESR